MNGNTSRNSRAKGTLLINNSHAVHAFTMATIAHGTRREHAILVVFADSAKRYSHIAFLKRKVNKFIIYGKIKSSSSWLTYPFSWYPSRHMQVLFSPQIACGIWTWHWLSSSHSFEMLSAIFRHRLSSELIMWLTWHRHTSWHLEFTARHSPSIEQSSPRYTSLTHSPVGSCKWVLIGHWQTPVRHTVCSPIQLFVRRQYSPTPENSIRFQFEIYSFY